MSPAMREARKSLDRYRDAVAEGARLRATLTPSLSSADVRRRLEIVARIERADSAARTERLALEAAFELAVGAMGTLAQLGVMPERAGLERVGPREFVDGAQAAGRRP